MKRTTLFHIFIASGFGSGFCPVCPGTAGALLATALWFLLSYFLPPGLLLPATGLLIVLFTGLGILSANALEPVWGKDPSRIVVDEMVGVWIALLAAPAHNVGYAAAAFVLFRLFDIFKPLGIRKMENFKGGVGVMMDDILAGIYSFTLLAAARCWIG